MFGIDCDCFEDFSRCSRVEAITLNRLGKLGRGRMAEWSIAAVLKTAGLTAPGVRIPLLPFKGNEAFYLPINSSWPMLIMEARGK